MHLKIPVFVIPSYKILHFKNDGAGADDDDDDDDGGGTYVHMHVRPYHMRILRGKTQSYCLLLYGITAVACHLFLLKERQKKKQNNKKSTSKAAQENEIFKQLLLTPQHKHAT